MRLGLLRVGHLREHKLKHSFQDTLNPICSCGSDVESTSHYTLHCPIYNDKRHTLLSTIKNINCRFLDVTETIVLLMRTLIHTFLMQKLNLSELLKGMMNLCFILNKKILFVFLSFI